MTGHSDRSSAPVRAAPVRRPDLVRRDPSGKPTGLRRSFADLWSPRVLYVDTHEAARPLWWVIGSQRSGTTWVAEMLDPAQRARLIFEPFHASWSGVARSLRLSWGSYLPPGLAHPGLGAAVDRIAAGRVRDPWIDRRNRRRLYRSRIVKDVSATNLVGWLQRRRPADRFLYVVRHPFAVAWSLRQLGWRESAATTSLFAQPLLRSGPLAGVRQLDALLESAAADDFQRLVLKWCFENAATLALLPASGIELCFYEHLVDDAMAELDRIGAAARPGEQAVDPSQPSAADFRGRAARAAGERPRLVTEWQQHVSEAEAAAGMEILAAFGLDRYYGVGPRPLAPPGGFRRSR